MFKPVLKGEALLRNIRASAKSPDRLGIWWLGQSGFLIQFEGVHLLCDPFLSDSPSQKTAPSGQSPARMTEAPLEPHQLDFIKVVTVSDSQPDHLDVAALKVLFEANPSMELFVPEAIRDEVGELLGCDMGLVTGLDENLSESLEEMTITGVPAIGESDRDGEGRCRRLGYVTQFGPWMIYHSGDAVVFDGLEERLQGFAIDVALLPIGGSQADLAETMTAVEAAELAKAVDARLVIPCHYEMFDSDTSKADEFARACERLGQSFRVLRCGEQWSDRELEDLAGEEDEEETFDRSQGRGRARPGAGDSEDY